MSKKIFRSILLVAMTVFAASLIFIMGALLSYFTSTQLRQLRNETELAARGIVLNGADYLEELGESADFRITWVDGTGEVIYDNAADKDKLENHLEREEIKEAFETGYGESARYSSTLSEKLLYSAKLLPDNTVIRLSFAQNTVWTILWGFAAPICAVILIAIVLSTVLAANLTRQVMEPINGIDLDDPVKNEVYEELKPFINKIDRQQKQIKSDREAILKNEEIRQEFTANVSHELKTPLQAISGYAELLKAGIVNEKDIRPFANRIYTEAGRLSTLVDDIIDLTKLDNGSGYKWEQTDLYVIAKNVEESLQSTAEAKNVSVSLEGEGAGLYGVAQLLHSIVYNLLDNAIKYNKEDGSVRICVKDGSEDVTLTVSDTGVGIPEDSLDRIFERFYRVDKGRSKEVGGTGLGLSIVKHAAMIMNAAVEVNSSLGEGTVFRVTVPKRKAPDFKAV